MFNPINIVYVLILFAAIVNGRNSKSIIRGLIGVFIVMNVMHLDLLRDTYATKFVGILVYELVNLMVSFIALQLSYNFSNMSKSKIIIAVELLISCGLVYLFYFTAGLLIAS